MMGTVRARLAVVVASHRNNPKRAIGNCCDVAGAGLFPSTNASARWLRQPYVTGKCKPYSTAHQNKKLSEA